MRFLKIDSLSPSPDSPGYVRSEGVIYWATDREFRLWVDVPAAYAEFLSESGNAWLAAMLPVASCIGEDIEIDLPVDALLLENVHGVMATWHEWYPELKLINIHCPIKTWEPTSATKSAAFFSGGIDSYFTVARRMPGNSYGIPAVDKVDDLITVWGFDVAAHKEKQSQYLQLEKGLKRSAESLGLNHFSVRTNVRDMEKYVPFKFMWRRLSQCAGLGFISLILEKRYNKISLGSTKAYGNLAPWGTHPLLDVLFSTSGLEINHDGACFSRDQKTDLVAKLIPARTALHVCFAEGGFNCSECDKCYRTMMTFDALGHRDAMKDAFDWSKYRVKNIEKFFIQSHGDEIYGSDITSVAKLNGREDIVSALNYAAKRSAILRPLVNFCEWLNRLPYVWRLSEPLKSFLLRGPIRKL